MNSDTTNEETKGKQSDSAEEQEADLTSQTEPSSEVNKPAATRKPSELELAVTGCEKNCDAEIVITISGESGPYADIHLLFAVICSLLAICFIVFTPIEFSELSGFFLIIITFLLSLRLSKKYGNLKVYLTSDDRQAEQVKKAAQLTYFKQAISMTKRRTGILIYFSTLEEKAEMICDTGIKQRMPANILGKLEQELNRIASLPDVMELMIGFIRELGQDLETYIPVHEDNPDELDNAPIYIKAVPPEN